MAPEKVRKMNVREVLILKLLIMIKEKHSYDRTGIQFNEEIRNPFLT